MVNISIDIAPPHGGNLPTKAVVRIEYAGTERTITWEYTGITTITEGQVKTAIDQYRRQVLVERNLAEIAETVAQVVRSPYSTGAGPLIRHITHYIDSVMPTVLAADIDARVNA